MDSPKMDFRERYNRIRSASSPESPSSEPILECEHSLFNFWGANCPCIEAELAGRPKLKSTLLQTYRCTASAHNVDSAMDPNAPSLFNYPPNIPGYMQAWSAYMDNKYWGLSCVEVHKWVQAYDYSYEQAEAEMLKVYARNVPNASEQLNVSHQARDPLDLNAELGSDSPYVHVWREYPDAVIPGMIHRRFEQQISPMAWEVMSKLYPRELSAKYLFKLQGELMPGGPGPLTSEWVQKVLGTHQLDYAFAGELRRDDDGWVIVDGHQKETILEALCQMEEVINSWIKPFFYRIKEHTMALKKLDDNGPQPVLGKRMKAAEVKSPVTEVVDEGASVSQGAHLSQQVPVAQNNPVSTQDARVPLEVPVVQNNPVSTQDARVPQNAPVLKSVLVSQDIRFSQDIRLPQNTPVSQVAPLPQSAPVSQDARVSQDAPAPHAATTATATASSSADAAADATYDSDSSAFITSPSDNEDEDAAAASDAHLIPPTVYNKKLQMYKKHKQGRMRDAFERRDKELGLAKESKIEHKKTWHLAEADRADKVGKKHEADLRERVENIEAMGIAYRKKYAAWEAKKMAEKEKTEKEMAEKKVEDGNMPDSEKADSRASSSMATEIGETGSVGSDETVVAAASTDGLEGKAMTGPGLSPVAETFGPNARGPYPALPPTSRATRASTLSGAAPAFVPRPMGPNPVYSGAAFHYAPSPMGQYPSSPHMPTRGPAPIGMERIDSGFAMNPGPATHGFPHPAYNLRCSAIWGATPEDAQAARLGSTTIWGAGTADEAVEFVPHNRFHMQHEPKQDDPAVWYFLYGECASSDILKKILGCTAEPVRCPAKVMNGKFVHWGVHTSLVDGEPEDVVHGISHFVTGSSHQDAVREFMGEKYEVVRCMIQLTTGKDEDEQKRAPDVSKGILPTAGLTFRLRDAPYKMDQEYPENITVQGSFRQKYRGQSYRVEPLRTPVDELKGFSWNEKKEDVESEGSADPDLEGSADPDLAAFLLNLQETVRRIPSFEDLEAEGRAEPSEVKKDVKGKGRADPDLTQLLLKIQKTIDNIEAEGRAKPAKVKDVKGKGRADPVEEKQADVEDNGGEGPSQVGGAKPDQPKKKKNYKGKKNRSNKNRK